MLKILTILLAFLVQLINYCQCHAMHQVVLTWRWRRTGMELDLYGCKIEFPTGFAKNTYS